MAGHVTGGGNPDWQATHAAARKPPGSSRPWSRLVPPWWAKPSPTKSRAVFLARMRITAPPSTRVPRSAFRGAHRAAPPQRWPPAWWILPWARIPVVRCECRPAFVVSMACAQRTAAFPSTAFCCRRRVTTPLAGLPEMPRLLPGLARCCCKRTIPQTRPRRLVIAEDAFAVADQAVTEALRPHVDRIATLIGAASTERLAQKPLAHWSEQQQILQGREAWETARDWIDQVNPRFSFEVAERYVMARAYTDADVAAARVPATPFGAACTPCSPRAPWSASPPLRPRHRCVASGRQHGATCDRALAC